ncbi:MAG: hypothetical protein PHE49_11650 [bacterium]|nr:hypothetical protein [bacterium]
MKTKNKESKMKQQDKKYWIKGVPPEKMISTVWSCDGLISAIRAILEFKSVEKKYLNDTILSAITGQPFRFWFSVDWASCLAYTHEEPVGVIVAKTLGFNYSWYSDRKGEVKWYDLINGKKTLDNKTVKTAWGKVIKEINSNNPVILFGGASPVDPKATPIVVTGYNLEQELIYFIPHTDWRITPKWNGNDPECKNGIKEQNYRARKKPDETNWVGNGFAPGQGMGGATTCYFSFREQKYKPRENEVAISIIKRAVGLGRGKLQDNTRKWRKSGLMAFDLLIECLKQEGAQFKYKNYKIPWSAIGDGDWFFAMEGLGGPQFRKEASNFLKKCMNGYFGNFSSKQKQYLKIAIQSYEKANMEMNTFQKLFEIVGSIGEYEERKLTVGKALSSLNFRKQAVEIVNKIRLSEEKAIISLEKVILL